MRVPQRLQIVARCLVVLTGNFLNIVASSSFMDCSSSGFDVPQREQRQCQSCCLCSIMRKRWFLAVLLRKGRPVLPSLYGYSVQKWPEIGKLVQIVSVLLLKLPSWQQLGYFWAWLLALWSLDCLFRFRSFPTRSLLL